MPELPEVEYIARSLDARLPGHTVRDARVRWERTLATHDPDSFRTTITGLTFRSVGRRGKFLLLELPPYWLIIHLRMTGRVYYCPAPQPDWEEHRHVHLLLELDDDARLYLHDIRKFGRAYLTYDPQDVVGGLGVEPLSPELTPERLADLLQSRRRQIKPLLLDQRVLAGLGNIYVDEALWAAAIHPLTRSDTLTDEQIVALHGSLRGILKAAIAHGGTTLRDYRGPCDESGQHQFALAVYGRAQAPCLRCGTLIERTVVAQRGTHYCPACQPPPPAQEETTDEPHTGP